MSTPSRKIGPDEGETSNRTSGRIIGFRNKASQVLFGIDLKISFPLFPITEDCESSVLSSDIDSFKDGVYVVVGDDDSSMEALSWTLNHFVDSSTVLYLVHVIPVMKFIPSPMGRLPTNQVNPEYINFYLNQTKGKTKLLLQSFSKLCVASGVETEVIVIEDDNVAKAIVDLVAKLDIAKLVLGTTKCPPSKSGSGKQNAIAARVREKVQESCEVKIICEGKEVNDQIIGCASIRSTDSINDGVYVLVGDDIESSMKALLWIREHVVTSSTVVYIINVFPEIRFIPSPMGKVPRKGANPEYVDFYLTREKDKIRELLLQSFIGLCVDSKVKVDTILIESNNVVKAVVELVAKPDVTKLVIGTTKSNLSKSSRRQNAIATQVSRNAQGSCDIKIVCDGEEVIDQVIGCVSTSPNSDEHSTFFSTFNWCVNLLRVGM